jgi:ABC-type Fe3+ transport system substrate-binding protein
MRSGVAVTAALLSAGCEAGLEHILVVYTSMDASVVDAVEDGFEASNPDIDVRMVALSPGDALKKLREEKGGFQVDVWWGAPLEFLFPARAEDLLAVSSPSWSPNPMEGSEGRWHVVGVSPFVLAFNLDETARSSMPRDWADIFHHRWADGVLLPDPERHVGTALWVGAWIDRESRRTGDAGAGFDWLRRLDDFILDYPIDADGVVDGLRFGTGAIGILPLAEVIQARRDGASWLEYTAPESGSPLVGLGAALVAGSEARPQGEAFLEYLGGPQAQESMEAAGWLEDVQGMTPWPVDYGRVSTNSEGWLERWRREVRGGGAP